MPILLEKFGHDLGVLISASHNPSEYNGIKLIDENGSKLSDDTEIDIENRILKIFLS
jgi:phosphoglucosamine mutase